MYKNYSSLYNLCDYKGTAQTDNAKFTKIIPIQFSRRENKIYRSMKGTNISDSFNYKDKTTTVNWSSDDNCGCSMLDRKADKGLGKGSSKGLGKGSGKECRYINKPEGIKFLCECEETPGGCDSSCKCGCSDAKKRGIEVVHNSGTCNIDGGGCGNNKLAPIMDPRFNIREVIKQIILLEDHLCHEEKMCYDCVNKHSLFIEGLLEEAITLDKEGKYIFLVSDFTSKFKDIIKEYNANKDSKDVKFYCYISQKLRALRKPIMNSSEKFCEFC